MKSAIKWCDRALIESKYFFGLATNERDFNRELKRLNVKRDKWPRFISERANATTYFLEHPKSGGQLAIVCLGESTGATGIQVAALLVHEAVHIWQAHTVEIGSFNDHGDEEEAYAIQAIAWELMTSYVEQTS